MAHPQVQHQPTFEDLELLAEVSQLLALRDLKNVLEEVINLMRTRVGADKASLMLLDGQDIDWQHLILMRDLDMDESIQVVKQGLDEGLAGWVIRERQGAIVYDTRTDRRWHVIPNETYRAGSALCVPFIHHDDVIAVLTLAHSEAGHFEERHLRMMTIVANQATVAIRNAELYHRAQSQQRQIEAVLQAIPVVLLVLDDQGKILLINAAGAELLGGAQQNIVGQYLEDFAQADRGLTPILDIVKHPEASGRFWSFETRSELHKLDFTVSVSMWETLNTAGYAVVMYDVTTSRDLHRFKDEMLKVASHDLRGPLSLIGGYCDLINEDLPEDSPHLREYLQVIGRSVDRMNGLLDDLLRVEQVRSSPLELREPVDLNDVVATVVEHTRPLADQKHQLFRVHLPRERLPTLHADRVQIREAMDNLVGNAIKYTPAGGRITLLAYTKEGYFHFVVEDNGVGIPEEHLSRIFDSYYRAKQDGTEGIEGTGLGLSLVKAVVERHAGEVWVRSEPGVGSQFGFWLPL
jgi:signal transduction histidine kinase